MLDAVLGCWNDRSGVCICWVPDSENALVPAAIAAERRAEVAHTEVILLAAAAGPRVTPRSPVPVTQSLFNSTSLLKNIKR